MADPFSGPSLIGSMAGTPPTIDVGFDKPAKLTFDNRAEMKPSSGFASGKYVRQKYNELNYNVELYLDNSGNFDAVESNRYYINPAAVLGMNISDTVTDWIVDGSLTFMYLPEDAKPAHINTTGNPAKQIKGAQENGEILKSYQFRGDGFDLLRVTISPISDNSKSGLGISLDGENPKWTLCYIFSIFDVEDVNDIPTIKGPLSTYMKCLRLKFHDVRYHMLKTANIEYSTAMPKDPTFCIPNFQSSLSNQGTLKTGEAMLDIMNFVLSKPENGGSAEFYQSMPNTNVPQELTQWEKGASEIFYTSPAQYSAYDDLSYLYSHHVSEKPLEGSEGINDLSLFHTERNNNFGYTEKICLTPLSDFFKKALEGDQPGELQKEHFFVTAHTEATNIGEASKRFRAPVGTTDDRDLKTFKYGQIVSYSFVDMSPDMNNEGFRTKPVYSVDIGKRSFNIQFKNNDVLSARNAISKSYISGLFKEGPGENLFLPTIHKRKESLNVFPTFSLNGENNEQGRILRQKNGIHNLLYTGVFQNACICFKTFGLTLRESGTFIAIDKSAGCDDNDYNNKLYGQWFVVKVDHLFEAGIYMNILYAVKLHRFKEMQTVFEHTMQG
jgi:hypothetical protein